MKLPRRKTVVLTNDSPQSGAGVRAGPVAGQARPAEVSFRRLLRSLWAAVESGRGEVGAQRIRRQFHRRDSTAWIDARLDDPDFEG